jgi:hypothetical protein
MSPQLIQGNRAPVMTRWAAVVAERLGHAPDAALTLGKAVAGLNAHAKGRRLGLYEAPPDQAEAPASPRRPTGGQRLVPVRGRAVPAVRTSHGVRATSNGQPIDPGPGRRSRSSPRPTRETHSRPERTRCTSRVGRPCRQAHRAGVPQGSCAWTPGVRSSAKARGQDGPAPGWLSGAVGAAAHTGGDGPQRRRLPPCLAVGVVGRGAPGACACASWATTAPDAAAAPSHAWARPAPAAVEGVPLPPPPSERDPVG